MKNAQVLFSSLMVVIILVAVLKQIRGQMTEDQPAAIEAMELTPDDFQAWLQGQGLGRPGTGDERATVMAEMKFQRPEGATGGPGGLRMRGGSVLLQPVINFLAARAAEQGRSV